MAKGIGKGNAEGSRRALEKYGKSTQFKPKDKRTEVLRQKAVITRRTNAEKKERAEASLDAYDDVYFTPHSPGEIKDRMLNGETHQERVVAARSLNLDTADEDLKWYYDRILGKPKQVVDNNITGDLEVSKPPIVFKDVESASREGEEERLHSEEEDI